MERARKKAAPKPSPQVKPTSRRRGSLAGPKRPRRGFQRVSETER